ATFDTSTAFTHATTEAQNFRSATGPTGGSADFYNGGGAGVGYTADGGPTDNFIYPALPPHPVEKCPYNGTTATLEGSVTVVGPTGLVVSVSGSTADIYVTNGTGSNTYA